MAEWSERRLAVALAWLEIQWGRPSRADHYAMAVARQVHCVQGMFSRGFKAPGLDDFRLEFGGGEQRQPVTREQAAAYAKAKWAGLMTMPIRHVVKEADTK